MSFGPDSIYGLDIESLNDEGQGLSAVEPRSRVTEVSVAIGRRHEVGEVFADDHEARMFGSLDSYLTSLPAGLIVTWNGSFFDMPFLSDRMAICGFSGSLGPGPDHLHTAQRGPLLTPDPQLVPKYAPLPGHVGGYSGVWSRGRSRVPHQHLDISLPYKKVAEALGVKWSLKPVCAALGIEMVELDRENLHQYSAEERRAYVLSDAAGTRELALRLLGLSESLGIPYGSDAARL